MEVEQLLRTAQPLFWSNPDVVPYPATDPFGPRVDEAGDRLRRAAPLLAKVLPGMPDGGSIRSPLLRADGLARVLGAEGEAEPNWWVKADHALPVAGSVKARGGFHEIIAHAERLAATAGLVDAGGDLLPLAGDEARRLFSRHSVIVGSTGNLGMSIGLMASALGFSAIVHMSSDAKAWKKRRLRDAGVTVVEHAGDYALAVANGRDEAAADARAHFVDDEQSVDLMVGYAAAAEELHGQLLEEGIVVGPERQLFVYVPCGVGGAPGGIAYGLKRLYGGDVHVIFGEPVQSPCMLVQLMSGSDDPVSVYDVGLSNRTDADGLAVGQASMLVAPLMRERLDAIYTVADEQLPSLIAAEQSGEAFGVEPSAAVAFAGPIHMATLAGRAHADRLGISDLMSSAVHVMWTTGGSLVPEDERAAMLRRAAAAPAFVAGP